MPVISPESAKPEQQLRLIHINNSDHATHFCNNAVVTSKYTVKGFIPKNIWEQFRRISNCYFLLISILQLSTDLSPTNPYSTITPLMFVLIMSMVKEGIEDMARHRADSEVNNYKATVVQDGKLVEKLWKDIAVGEIVKLNDKSPVPADIVVLSSSEPEGMCYIETSSLDGENNLKLKQALHETNSHKTDISISQIRGTFECEQPNNRLYNFDGTVHLDGAFDEIPVTNENVILRGAVLRNSSWIYGVVVFTGKDTKLMKNSKAAPSKRSNIDLVVNRTILIIFVTLGVMCSISTILSAVWVTSTDHSSYLHFLKKITELEKSLAWITFLILFNNLVPISLYITLELIKWYQARAIDQDEHMYHKETNTPALARTSNLNEDLGQIHYVFSDKTGTLTKNEMHFRKCSIGGHIYGNRFDETESFDEVSATKVCVYKYDPEFKFTDPKLIEHLTSMDHPNRENVNEFLLCLSLCHSVIPERVQDTIVYRAASPDEGALVLAAKCLGFEFTAQSQKSVKISIFGQEQIFEILNINAFTSTRKRMSVVVRLPDKKLVLYCKGADNIIRDRLRIFDTEYSDRDSEFELLDEHLRGFASDGLRTLMIAKKEIDESWYEEWNKRFINASNNLHNREGALASVADEIECGLEILGATAIEDQLQDGVPETIASIASAGIKIWVLTGDKEETAVNIGRSCRLLRDYMRVVVLNADDPDMCKRQLEYRKQELIEQGIWRPGVESSRLALVVDGTSLQYLLPEDPEYETQEETETKLELLTLAKQCKAVIACRVSPLQKAMLVKLVKDNVKPSPVTLAIGDGANDVSMIQEAHVGIGISGNEGMQAVRSSDYAIAQFRFFAAPFIGSRSFELSTCQQGYLLFILQEHCIHSHTFLLLFLQWIFWNYLI